MKYKALATGMLCCLFSGMAAAEIMVVAHSKSDIASVDQATLKKLFLGKTSKIGGMKVRAVNLPDSNALKLEFDEKVVNKNPNKMKAYWANRIFTGKGKPLDQVSSEENMIIWLAENKNGIGYVSADSVNSKLKVLLTIP
ncbi:MAG: hypothetical protein JKY01_10765 [Pseudomonadales bacterium]|nr:hypothetical protein [Pseudomonadales bacterium]